MGYYVNPQEGTKESFLKEKGIEVPANFQFGETPKGMLPVILVKNPGFTAAAIAYSEREFAAFTDPKDHRPKMIFLVLLEDLLPVTDEGFAEYIKRNL